MIETFLREQFMRPFILNETPHSENTQFKCPSDLNFVFYREHF